MIVHPKVTIKATMKTQMQRSMEMRVMGGLLATPNAAAKGNDIILTIFRLMIPTIHAPRREMSWLLSLAMDWESFH